RGGQLLDRLRDEAGIGQRLSRLGGVGGMLGDGDRTRAGLGGNRGQAARALLARGGSGSRGGSRGHGGGGSSGSGGLALLRRSRRGGRGLEDVDGKAVGHRRPG